MKRSTPPLTEADRARHGGRGRPFPRHRDGEDKLAVLGTPNQDNPLMDAGGAPLLGIDVWKHACYLKYQNDRTDYLTARWKTVTWAAVNTRTPEAGGT